MPVLNHKYNYHDDPAMHEVNSGELLVETAGYMTTQQIVESMILAGQRLGDYRDAVYNVDDDADLEEILESPVPPDKYSDYHDVIREAINARNRLNAAAAAFEAAKSAPGAADGGTPPANPGSSVE